MSRRKTDHGGQSKCAALLLIASLLASALAPLSAVGDDARGSADYQYRPSTQRGGTGKFYMGREIAEVIGYQAEEWLDREQREQQERTDLLLGSLPLKPADVVADIGAGTGYMSFRLSPLLPRGKVIAIDIQPEMLNLIKEDMRTNGAKNIETRLATERDPKLGRASVDLALLVDSYHEFSYPREMMRGIVRGLKRGGVVAIVEYRGEDASVPIKPLHKMTQAQIKQELLAAGLVWRETKELLPWQHLMIFAKP